MNDRLKNYLALTAGFIAITPLADAQIIYTDINPDSVLSNNGSMGMESLSLDINHDGISDFAIMQEYTSTYNMQNKIYGNKI